MEEFIKHDNGKPEYNLVPPEFNLVVAQIITMGKEMYGKENWKKCKDTDRYVNALMRHLEAYRGGEKIDPESGMSHLGHIGCNAAFLYWFDVNTKAPDKNTLKLFTI